MLYVVYPPSSPVPNATCNPRRRRPSPTTAANTSNSTPSRNAPDTLMQNVTHGNPPAGAANRRAATTLAAGAATIAEAIIRLDDQLGQHRVVVRRDLEAAEQGAVEPHARGRGPPTRDALRFARERSRRHAAGTYQPCVYMIVWERKPLLAWARRAA